MIYVANAFSLQMLVNFEADVTVREITERAAESLVRSRGTARDLTSAIGHADTAKFVSKRLGHYLPAQRIDVSLKKGDTLLVAQFVGGRLKEGATKLPEGVALKYLVVEVYYPPRPCQCGSGQPFDECGTGSPYCG